PSAPRPAHAPPAPRPRRGDPRGLPALLAPARPRRAVALHRHRRDGRLLRRALDRRALPAEPRHARRGPMGPRGAPRASGRAAMSGGWDPLEDHGEEPAAASPFIDWAEFWSRDHTAAEWLVEDVLARGRGHSLYASRKSGKSLLMLWLALRL